MRQGAIGVFADQRERANPSCGGIQIWRIPDDESDDDDDRYQREDSREEKMPGILQWLERFLDLD